MSTTLEVQLTLVTLLASLVFFKFFRGPPVPPGPPGKLFSGIADSHPRQTPWVTYHDWAKKYGM